MLRWILLTYKRKLNGYEFNIETLWKKQFDLCNCNNKKKSQGEPPKFTGDQMSFNDDHFNFKIFNPPLSSLLSDDIEQQILSPLSCLREFGNTWLLEFDLPLVNKKDIKVIFDGNAVTVEAKLKEIYSEEKLGVKTKFEFFKKTKIGRAHV